MTEAIYPAATRELADQRRALAPETEKAFQAFSRQVFADGALPSKTKLAHATQCPYCIRGHTKAALRQDATRQEIMERFGLRPRCARVALTRTPP